MISGLIDLLNNDADFKTLAGGEKAHAVRAPQGTKRPYVVLRRTAVPTVEYKNAPSDTDKPFFNVMVFSENYKNAEEISNRIRAVLDGYKDNTYKQIWYVDAEDLFDPQDGDKGSVVISNKYRAFVAR